VVKLLPLVGFISFFYGFQGVSKIITHRKTWTLIAFFKGATYAEENLKTNISSKFCLPN